MLESSDGYELTVLKFDDKSLPDGEHLDKILQNGKTDRSSDYVVPTLTVAGVAGIGGV